MNTFNKFYKHEAMCPALPHCAVWIHAHVLESYLLATLIVAALRKTVGSPTRKSSTGIFCG
jgi:hypothetical protein